MHLYFKRQFDTKKYFYAVCAEEYFKFMCKILIADFPDLIKMMLTAVLPESVRQKHCVRPHAVFGMNQQTSRNRILFYKPSIHSDDQKFLTNF
jgi:hypothetical protein